MRVVFDTRELYFLTQYLPVSRVLARRGVECSFVAYHNRPEVLEDMGRVFAEDDLQVTWCESREDGLAYYQRERPDFPGAPEGAPRRGADSEHVPVLE